MVRVKKREDKYFTSVTKCSLSSQILAYLCMFIMYKLDRNPLIDARDIHGKPEKITVNRSRIRTHGLDTLAYSIMNFEMILNKIPKFVVKI